MDNELRYKKILIVAPVPPPITGQSIASDLVYRTLKENFSVDIINTSKNSFKAGINSLNRVLSSIILISKILVSSNRYDYIYYTVSQSKFGALKDVIIFLLLWPNLKRLILHSHGFGLKHEVLDKSFILRYFYKRISTKIKSIIVLGESHKNLFSDLLPGARFEIVKNCADDRLIVDANILESKFERVDHRLNLLFLSNLLPGKGYIELFSAFESLSDELKANVKLTFAGGFASEGDKSAFLNAIKGRDNVSYVGVVGLDEKKLLLHQAHVFCLPTYYRFEGQPISILEAYSSGCVVLTTKHAGIPDIATKKNGFIVSLETKDSLRIALEKIIRNRELLIEIGKHNFALACSEYKEDNFKNAIRRVFKSEEQS